MKKRKVKITSVRTVVNRGTAWRCMSTTQIRIEMPRKMWDEICDHYPNSLGWVCQYVVYDLGNSWVELVATNTNYCWAYAYWLGYIHGKGIPYDSVIIDSDEIHDKTHLK